MKTSPTNTIRHDSSVVAQPPTIGPTAIPAPATPPMTAYAALRWAPSKFPAIRAASAGNTSAAPTPSSTDQPSARTGTDLRHSGQRRAAGIDDQADDERPSTTDHVADLGAGEDQHRHHQAVEGDDGLDRRHRGVEVIDQLTDRDVHHGLVEHHQELRRGQRDQCRPVVLRRSAGHLPLCCLLIVHRRLSLRTTV